MISRYNFLSTPNTNLYDGKLAFPIKSRRKQANKAICYVERAGWYTESAVDKLFCQPEGRRGLPALSTRRNINTRGMHA